MRNIANYGYFLPKNGNFTSFRPLYATISCVILTKKKNPFGYLKNNMYVFDVFSYSSQYRSEPRKPRVNTKTIGPIGHPGKPTKGFSGNAGVRTLDISEYEDSREYPKYGPAEREYRPEYPPPDRSRQYTDPREYGPEEFRPEYPSPYRN